MQVILAGDFSLPNINWENLDVGKHDAINSEKMLELALNHNLTQMVQEHTRVIEKTQSVLDLVFISDNIPEHTTSVVDGISDHMIVLLTIPASVKKCNLVPPITVVKSFLSADDTSIIDHLEKFYDEFEHMVGDCNVEEIWLFFRRVAFFCISNYVPDRAKKIHCKKP